LKTKLFKILLI